MISTSVFIIVVLVPGSILGKCVDARDDPTYDDLLRTNVTCAFSESCFVNESNPYSHRSCSCDEDCSVDGTCCIDSPHRGTSTQMVECRNVALTFLKYGYFMVSRCPPEVGSESPWKDLCEREWNGEDDMMMLAPVSSEDTLITYKNYYCFRCHEDGDRYLNWDMNIVVTSSVDEERISEDFAISYDKEKQRWTATTGDDYVLEDNVTFTFFVPNGVTVSSCIFVLVSDCHDDWTDEGTREKCRSSYTAIVYTKYNSSVSYKNPHCALCNFEEVENISCQDEVHAVNVVPISPPKRFSFSYLLNIHREDTDKKETKRCKENQLWDPYGKKCRRIACAIPGYVVREGRCTPP